MFPCLKKQETGFGTGEEFVPIWGFITAHTASSGGAMSWDRTMNEYQYSLRMLTSMEFPWENRSIGGIKKASRLLFEKNINCSIEPHFNAFNGSAFGGEFLVLKGDSLSEKYAEHIAESFAKIFPKRKLRHGNGIKYIRPGERGYRNLKDAKDNGMMVAIISELFFGDNPDDFMKFGEQAHFWEQTLVHSVIDY